MIGTQTSAFGEQLVVSPNAEIQVSFPYENLNTDIVTVTEENSGTVSNSGQHALLEPNAINGKAVLQSRNVLRYGPGQGALIRFACRFTPDATSNLLVGIGDANDGYFIGFEGTNFCVFRRQGGEQTITYKSDFDSVDATGARGNSVSYSVDNHDFTKGNVFQIRYQWLGYGRIMFYIEEPESGLFRLFHAIEYADLNTATSIENPTLPMWVEAEEQGVSASPTSQIFISSFGAYTEGPQPEKIFTRNSISASATSTTSEIPTLTIRNKSTFNSITNRVTVMPDFSSLALESGTGHRFRFLLNANLTGASYTDISTNTSVVDYDVTASAVSGGKEILSELLAAAGSTNVDLGKLRLTLRPGDTLTITNEKLTGAAAATSASITWRELF